MFIASFYNLLLRPFYRLPEGWALMLISAAVGLLLLLIYRFTSNQKGIRRAKQKLQAHLLEIVLYRHDLGLLWQAEKKLLVCNLVYLRYTLAPLGVALLLLAPLFGPLNLQYGYRALREGERTLLTVKLRPDQGLQLGDLSLQVPPGVEVEAEVRIPYLQEVSWRIVGTEKGRYLLNVVAGEQQFAKEFVVGEGLHPISLKRLRSGFRDSLLHSAEAPLPRQAALESLSLQYQPTQMDVGPWRLPWWLLFLLVSMVVAFAVKGRLGVQV